MGDRIAIEWTDATWNPIVGCSIVSPGCTNCYAMRMAARINKMTLSSHYEGLTRTVNGNPVWTGHVAQAPDYILTAPLRWKRPRRVFVNSMGDLFHESIPDEWIDRVFAVMALCPQHTFQVLTKRAGRMHNYVKSIPRRRVELIARDLVGPSASVANWPLPSAWLGISAERQQEADERIPLLLDTPAAVRFASLEPLLGPINLTGSIWKNNAIGRAWLDWVIVGGESGPHARPMHPQWARDLRDQCAAAGVSYFFKQFGEWKPLNQITNRVISGAKKHAVVYQDGSFVIDTDVADPPRAVFTFCVGKKAAGRLLDGRTHDEFPQAGAAS